MKPVRLEIILDDSLSPAVRQANKEMTNLHQTTSSVESAIKKLAGAFAIKELVSKIASVRGEFQQLEVAFRTMLGSASKADELMQQLTRTAATTPFGLEDVANGAKQLLAYGFGVETVNDTLIRLGDIAAGLSMPLNDLVYLYGTTMAQGRLYTQDLNQFTGRGIPMIQELAKQFGVAESKVKGLVEAGKVGFPEVQKVIENLTNEGSQFGGLMEAQSKTITGQIANIEDAIDMMFNQIGQQSEGIINTTLSGVSYVIENYERFGRVLLGLVGTYGVYRTAVMTVVAAKGFATAAEALHYNWLLLVEKAQKMLNATMLKNPYVLVATAIAAVVAAMMSMKTEAERLKEAEEKYQEQKQKTIDAEEEHRRKLEELCSIAGDEALSTDTRREALNKLEQKYPDIFTKYDTEYEKLKNIKQIKEEIAALEAGKSITNPRNELEAVNQRIAELEAKKAAYNKGGSLQFSTVGRLTAEEKAELKNLRAKRPELEAQIRKEDVNTWFANLTGIDNDTLEAEIKRRQNLLAKMAINGTTHGVISKSSELLNGTYSRDELQYQLNKLKSEQNRRNLPTDSSSDWVATAKKKYEDALKAYNDFISDTSNALSQEDFEAQAQALKDAVDAAKKEYDSVAPVTDKDPKEKSHRIREEQKLGEELVKLQIQNDEAVVEAMDEGTEKKLAKIEAEYTARKAEIEQQRRQWTAKGGSLSNEQSSALDTADDLNETKRRRAIAQVYSEEFSLMRENLQNYGSYQAQKLAIATEYAQKIKNAGSEAEKLKFSTERDNLLVGIQTAELQGNIDWSSVLGEFGSMYSSALKPILNEVKEYMGSAEYAGADAKTQQSFNDLVKQLDQSLGTVNKVSLAKLGQEVNDYLTIQARLSLAQEEYSRAFEELTKAQEEYEQALAYGTTTEQESAKQALATAQTNYDAAKTSVDTLNQTSNGLQQNISNTATTLSKSMSGVISGLQKMSSGSLSGAYTGLLELSKSAKNLKGSLGDAFKKVADTLESVPIVGWIVSIIDIFKDGLSIVIEGLLDAVFNAVSGIIDDVFSGDLFVTIGDTILSGIGKIFNAISFGGLGSLFGDGESDEDLKDDIELLTLSNEDLQRSIDNLSEKMSDAAVADASGIYQEQIQRIQQEIANTQEMMARAGAAYNNGIWGIGGSKSSNKKIDEQMTTQEWNRISIIVGRPIKSAADFWKLSSEEMAKVADEATDLYSKIKDLADEGYQDAAKYMDDYIEYYKELEELQDAYYEKLTGSSFDSIEDEFKDTLLDMEADADTFADNFNDIMLNALVENMMSETYSQRLKDWYSQFATAMEDGKMTDTELDTLKQAYQDIVNDAIAERNALASAVGAESSTSQSGKSGSFTAMSQEQGTKLEGLFVSVQGHVANIDVNLENVIGKMSVAESHLARIEKNTGSSAEILETIKKTIDVIHRDGIKTR